MKTNITTLNLLSLADDASNQYAKLRSRMPGPTLVCSENSKNWARERLAKLKGAEVNPAARPAFELETSALRALSSLDTPNARQHLKALITSALAVAGISDMADPYVVFQVRKNMSVSQELHQARLDLAQYEKDLRATEQSNDHLAQENDRLIRQINQLTLGVAEAGHVALVPGSAAVEAVEDDAPWIKDDAPSILESDAPKASEPPPGFADAVAETAETTKLLYETYGTKLQALQNELAEGMTLAGEVEINNDVAQLLLGLVKRADTVILDEILTPWDDSISGSGFGVGKVPATATA